METIQFEKTRDVKLPERGTPLSAGIDFFVPHCFFSVTLLPKESILIPSGIKALIPSGYCLMAQNKSGVCTRTSLVIGAGLIDEDYQGEIHLHLINSGPIPVKIVDGMKIAQFVLIPVSYARIKEGTNIHGDKTIRGNGGFGSTDI